MMNLAGTSVAVPGPPCVIATTASYSLKTATASSMHAVATACMLLAVAVFKLYDAVVAMTQGGPGTASEVPAKFIMDHLFLRSNIGLASAGAVLMLVPVIALVAPYLYARSRREHA